MDSLILRNNGSSPLTIPDMGVEILVGEDQDLIPGFKNEEILESQDFPSLWSHGGQITLTSPDGIFVMSYQDVVDYLTPLTRWTKLDYAYISGKDATSDITAIELEELTTGSDTSLHTHDYRYYTKNELSSSGQAVVHWNNIVGSPTGDTRIINSDIYFRDPARGNKWLSSSEVQYSWSDNSIDGKYMSIGDIVSADAGYLLPQDFTITKIAISSTGHPTKELQIRINDTAVETITLINGKWTSTSLNIDAQTGDMLKMFVSASGNPIKDAIVTIFGKWRGV